MALLFGLKFNRNMNLSNFISEDIANGNVHNCRSVFVVNTGIGEYDLIENDNFFIASYQIIHDKEQLLSKLEKIDFYAIDTALLDNHFIGTYFVFIHNKRTGDYTFLNDKTGLFNVFTGENRRCLFITSAPTTILRWAYGEWRLNRHAMLVLLGIGWVPQDQSVVSQVSAIRPNTRIVGNSNADKNSVVFSGSRAVGWDDLPRNTEGAKQEAAIVAYGAMKKLVARVANICGGRITSAISGGRDSRIIASLVLSQDIPVTFKTTNNFDRETETVKTILHKYRGEHCELVVTQPGPSDKKAVNPIESADFLCQSFGGHFEPSRIGAVAPTASKVQKSLTTRTQYTLSGLGGEMVHGFYYPKTFPDSYVGFIKNLYRRIAWVSFSQNIVEDTMHHMLQQEKATFDLLYGSHLHPLKFLDFFYYTSRLRRWSDIARRVDVCAPLCCTEFLRYSMMLAPNDVVGNVIPKKLVGFFDPQWSDIPFFKTEKGDQRNWVANQADPLAMVDYVDDESILDVAHGPDWKSRMDDLAKTRGGAARVVVLRALAVNALSRMEQSVPSKP